MASLRIKWALFSCPCRGVRGRGLKKKTQLRLPRILAHWMCFEESRWLIRRSLYQVRFEFLIWISRFLGLGLFPALLGKGVNFFYSVNGKNLNFFCFIGLVLLPLSFAIAHGGFCNFYWGRFILWIGGMTVIIMAIPNFQLLRWPLYYRWWQFVQKTNVSGSWEHCIFIFPYVYL